MKFFMKGKWHWLAILIAIATITIVFIVGFIGYKKILSHQASKEQKLEQLIVEQQKQLSKAQQELATNNQQIATLSSSSQQQAQSYNQKVNSLKQSLETTQQKNQQLEGKIESLQGGLSSAQEQIQSTQNSLTEADGSLPPDFIKKIQPAVVLIDCVNPITSGVSIASGHIMRRDGENVVFTNAHVLTQTWNYQTNLSPRQATNCFVFFPHPPNFTISKSGDYSYNLLSGGAYFNDNWKDFAWFPIGQPMTQAISSISSLSDLLAFCNSNDVSVGDNVTIFGYPSSGNLFDISETVTQGIISGISPGPIYKTSAGIDHGNSGGVAVLNKKKCYLGIPTWGISGTTAGIGYIQSWQLATQ